MALLIIFTTLAVFFLICFIFSYIDKDSSPLLAIGFIFCLIFASLSFDKYVTDKEKAHSINDNTVVLFDNGNNKIDTLVFQSDTIHANDNNIWE
jgi:hypothetical protein